MELIKIHGEKKKFDYEEVKYSVVKIGTRGYYWRSDRSLTTVNKKFYRKKSLLIVKDESGKFIMSKDAITINGAFIIDKNSPNVCLIDKEYYHTTDTVLINKKRYLKTDKTIRHDNLVGNQWFLLKDNIVLNPEFYKNALLSPDNISHTVTDHTGALILRDDGTQFLTAGGDLVWVHFKDTLVAGISLEPVFKCFRDGILNPQINRIDLCSTKPEYLPKHFTMVAKISHFVHNTVLEQVTNALMDREERKLKDTDRIRKAMDCNYSDCDKEENKAKKVRTGWIDYEQHQGGEQHGYNGNKSIIGSHFQMTGNKKYSFGVEFETSAGDLTDVQLEVSCLGKWGDRSIGAYEYVTGVLCGNKGIKAVKVMTDMLSKNTFVDDRCALHVHIGGSNPEDAPRFNRQFSVAAIKLGCQLEDSLFAICPPSRSSKNHFTFSIKEFSDISPTNWKDLLGIYIFGNDLETETVQQQLKHRNRGFSKTLNSRESLGRWSLSRYKWLNLIHCNTASRFKTIEFRIFSGTTSFDKTYNYILICQAFVWAIENRQGRIWGRGYKTVAALIRDAYEKQPDIKKQVLAFIRKKITKFNKK